MATANVANVTIGDDEILTACKPYIKQMLDEKEVSAKTQIAGIGAGSTRALTDVQTHINSIRERVSLFRGLGSSLAF